MKKVDKHGLKIVGLKKTCSKLEDCNDDSFYYEIFYDRKTGEVWANFHVSLGGNEWTEYHDSNIVRIGITSQHLTMQRISDLIFDTMQEIEYWENY